MNTNELCQRYLDALNKADLGAVLELFSDDAQILSPLYGARPASAFYRELFSDTARSQTTLLHVFEQVGAAREAVALHFHYDWTLGNGEQVDFECVDVFELAAEPGKFKKMTIIYDTAPLRVAFEASKNAGG